MGKLIGKSTLRSLIWCMSIRLGKTGYAKQVELQDSYRYIQRVLVVKRKPLKFFGLQYIGPAGRNRSYWTQERIRRLLSTHRTISASAELIQQSQLNYYPRLMMMTERGASCLAAIKNLLMGGICVKFADFTDLLPSKR